MAKIGRVKVAIDTDIKAVLDDTKTNILLLGTSGAGKSELINAYLDIDKEVAPVGMGGATTDHLAVYGEKSKLPYRLIDSPGLEYSISRQFRIAREMKKWLNDSVKHANPKTVVHIIWFCIDGQGKRSPEAILDYLSKVSDFWKGVPIIVVFTKSYFDTDVKENELMIRDALSTYKYAESLNVKGIISVTAKEKTDGNMCALPRGLDELEAMTLELAPESKVIFEQNMRRKKCLEKRLKSNVIIAGASASAAGIDYIKGRRVSLVLEQIQTEMLNSICDIYEVSDKSIEKNIADAILRTGIITRLGKAMAGVEITSTDPRKAMKKLTKATIAGSLTAIIGEMGKIAFERVYIGDIKLDDSDWDRVIRSVLKDNRIVRMIDSVKDAISNDDESESVKR